MRQDKWLDFSLKPSRPWFSRPPMKCPEEGGGGGEGGKRSGINLLARKFYSGRHRRRQLHSTRTIRRFVVGSSTEGGSFPLVRSSIRPLVSSLVFSLIRPLVIPSVRSVVQWFTRLLLRLLSGLLVCSFARPLVRRSPLPTSLFRNERCRLLSGGQRRPALQSSARGIGAPPVGPPVSGASIDSWIT